MVTPPSVIALFRLSRALSALTSVTKDLNVTVIIILEPLVDRLRRVGESVEQVAVTVSISGAVIGVFVMIRLRTSLSIAVTSAGLSPSQSPDRLNVIACGVAVGAHVRGAKGTPI